MIKVGTRWGEIENVEGIKNGAFLVHIKTKEKFPMPELNHSNSGLTSYRVFSDIDENQNIKTMFYIENLPRNEDRYYRILNLENRNYTLTLLIYPEDLFDGVYKGKYSVITTEELDRKDAKEMLTKMNQAQWREQVISVLEGHFGNLDTLTCLSSKDMKTILEGIYAFVEGTNQAKLKLLIDSYSF